MGKEARDKTQSGGKKQVAGDRRKDARCKGEDAIGKRQDPRPRMQQAGVSNAKPVTTQAGDKSQGISLIVVYILDYL